ncbi:AraC family transcriptional regulator [Sporosarcina sp.]|uniref:helix-turn-helix domain-containing protein n=1 Tax=Sporosarcina sp. TaxID=49982 RepID=UPI002635B7FB|nr:AraC family transcriptional regulator [Sporosarcina sp.]
MKQRNKALNELYYNLITNSPQTFTMEMPSDVGKGYISQTATKRGIIFSDWQMNYFADVNVQGINNEEYIQIMFCLNEGVSWGIMDGYNSVNIQKGESCIYKGHGKMECVCYAKERDFVFKNVKIPMSFFFKLLSDYFEIQETQAYKEKLFGGISKVNITPIMERILAETKEFVHFRGGLGHLYLDAKILELLGVYLREILEEDILTKNDISISKSERDSIMEAKRIIDSQLTDAPSCEKLAKQVQLSMSKLTKGFSNIVGMPIHAYIIDQRITRGAQLLLETGLNVSEVATMVGYSKPSNFSAAFKRKYGVVPKEYKRV